MSSPCVENGALRWFRLPEYVHQIVSDHADSILLETSRCDPSNHHSYVFLNPSTILVAYKQEEMPELFSHVEEARAKGFHVAGFFSYECGYHFQQISHVKLASRDLPLAWLGFYSNPLVFDHAQGHFLNPIFPPLTPSVRTLHEAITTGRIAMQIAEDQYFAKVMKIKEYISAGETYQVNFTDSLSFPLLASPSAAFEALSKQQPVSYNAFMNIAGHHILSFSPELFFRIDGRKIITRPMKGTMPRGLDLAEDAAAALRLHDDEKNRSEHVMIVDLMRNDLGRVCSAGSVQVEDLFSIEKYETLLQMTSTVSGTLQPSTTYYDIFRSLFPSGSVTGAPKIRTMQIIHELEAQPRGVYTGAIGFMAPNGSSVFNVAIRTLVTKAGTAQMGVGGGIVADSDPREEHAECLLKASFLTHNRSDFQLIETILWDKEFRFLSRHVERLESSARYFNFIFDRIAIQSELFNLANSFRPGNRYRVRLLLDSPGTLTVNSSEFSLPPPSGYVKFSSERTYSKDVFFRHKTTRRELYDRHYEEARAQGFDEVLFTNERDEVTEGAISNVFIKKSGKLVTPPLECGVLPGIYRRYLLEKSSSAEETILTVEDLKAADAVFLCNSVRGIWEVNSLSLDIQPRGSGYTPELLQSS